MLGSGMLEVAIGVIFVYVLVSLLCSSVREGIEAWTKTRAAYLEYGIRELLHDKSGRGLATHLYSHPLIHGLYAESYQPGRSDRRPGLLARGKNLPSYVPARNFALALLDMAARGTKTDVVSSDPNGPALSLAVARANVTHLDNEAVQRVLLTAIDAARGSFDAALANIEAWYDSSMERVAGWYKRSTQWILFWIALCVSVAGNFDTIAIAQHLYRNDAARAALVEKAGAAVGDESTLALDRAQAQQVLAELELPIGWGAAAPPFQPKAALATVVGWLLTALAATLGAPFWFDVLRKVMVIRTTVKPAGEHAAGRPLQQPFLQPTVPPWAPNAAFAYEAANVAGADLATLPRDLASDIDGCDRASNGHYEETPDEQLPVARGGVA